jgi:site-specific recombinase XerD
MKTFNEILVPFLAEIKIQLKPKSYSSYTGKTKVFSEWLNSKSLQSKPLSEITKHEISEFFMHLATDKALDRPTCQKYFLAIRKVFQYARNRELIAAIPFDLVSYPQKKADMSSEVIAQEHMKVLLGEIKKKDPQLYLACMVEYYCFIRPGTELRLLKVGDIDFNNGTIQVVTDHAKNGHKRIVTVPSQLSQIMSELGIDKADKSLYVFGKSKRPDGKPCSVNMLRYRFNNYRDKLGLSKGYKLYSFKCTGATRLHNTNTVSMVELMNQLGHSRLEATQRYLKQHAGFINPRIKEGFPSPY